MLVALTRRVGVADALVLAWTGEKAFNVPIRRVRPIRRMKTIEMARGEW
jgi:hypothetical protein